MKHVMRGVSVAAGAAAVGAIAWSQTARLRVERPAYTVVDRRGPIELREYPGQLLATTEVRGEFGQAIDEGFRRLARFIFGSNAGGESVAMTSPVASERIAMTSPVGAEPAEEGWRVSFTMPAEYSADTLPRPEDPRVEIERTPRQRVAALRFSGRVTGETFARRRARLLDRLREERLRPSGAVRLAQYDPPWTLPFLRRNEVQVPVE